MPTDITGTLKSALDDLESERVRLEHQISAVRSALEGLDGSSRSRALRRRGRRQMSSAERAAVSRRMKAYWAKRRAAKQGASATVARGRKPRAGAQARKRAA